MLLRAPASTVWHTLGRALPSSRASQIYAAVVGADDRRPTGGPLQSGSTVPGFAVREAVVPQRLVLAGRHRFSSYTLTFLLEEDDWAELISSRTVPRRHLRAVA